MTICNNRIIRIVGNSMEVDKIIKYLEIKKSRKKLIFLEVYSPFEKEIVNKK